MPVRQPVRRHSRARLALFDLVEQVSARLGGKQLYRRSSLRAGRLRIREEVVHGPPELAGLRLAHLSDLHAGALFDTASLRAVVDQVLALEPHGTLLTGDFVAHEVQAGVALAPELARLAHGEVGAFAVFGNHDYRGRREQALVQALTPLGWTFLRNDARPVLAGRLWVSGVEDPEEGRLVGLEHVRSRMPADAWEVCLCHNPSAAPALARAQCLAILSGHTHGRQIDLPLLRNLGPAHPGGRVHLGHTRLVVSNGLGVIGAPLRVGAPAEVVLLTFTEAPPSALLDSRE